MAGSGPTIQIPRWIQLVVLPVALLLAFLLASTLGHVLFLFLTASVIAFTLNPLVRDLTRLKVPRAPSVFIVFAIFLAVVSALLIAIGAVAFEQARHAADRIDEYVTEDVTGNQTAAELDIDRLQAWLDDHGLEQIQVREQVNDWLDGLSAGEVSGYAQDAISFAQGAAFSFVVLLFSVILIVVISIYMLLDMQRLERTIDARFPPHGGVPLTQRIESALWGYLKGQAILSTVIGTSAGVGMYILGVTGLVEGCGGVRACSSACGRPSSRSSRTSGRGCRPSRRSSSRSLPIRRGDSCGSGSSSSSSTRWRGTSSCRT